MATLHRSSSGNDLLPGSGSGAEFDPSKLEKRRAFYELSDDDLARLAGMRPFAEAETDEIVERFYDLLLEHEESRAFFRDDAVLDRVKRAQKRYFLGLFSGVCDVAYVEDRLRVGAAHERIGLGPKWYLAAYSRYLRLLHDRVHEKLGDSEETRRFYRSLQKMVCFDMALAMDAYIAPGIELQSRQQHAIRELSTPVIQVHEGILLLPLVGAVDSLRAAQIMEAVLVRVVELQARIVLLDIAGVVTVDTAVLQHLLQLTSAVRLLGAEAVLTGIRPEIARTIVDLGVDVSSMHTRSRLAEGIELGLRMIGKAIRPGPH